MAVTAPLVLRDASVSVLTRAPGCRTSSAPFSRQKKNGPRLLCYLQPLVCGMGITAQQQM